MEGYLIGYDGSRTALPVLLSWSVSFSNGSPCDAFSLSCVFTPTWLPVLEKAVRFEGAHKGETVFTGVVDEYEVKAGSGGLLLSVWGRGLAALLIDNEAEAAEYETVRLEDILNSYVSPLGIADIDADRLSAVSGFTVESGWSMWKVLEQFTHYCAGITPLFSQTGTLIIGERQGKTINITGSTAVTSSAVSEKRYGVVSEVLVVNKVRGVSQTVLNEDFIKRGGMCRRVINVPRNSDYRAMKYTGSYQIQQSEADCRYVTCALPELFAAVPGDIVNISGSPLGVDGAFKVKASEIWSDSSGRGTVLKLI